MESRCILGSQLTGFAAENRDVTRMRAGTVDPASGIEYISKGEGDLLGAVSTLLLLRCKDR
jgi:hypothetical protein